MGSMAMVVISVAALLVVLLALVVVRQRARRAGAVLAGCAGGPARAGDVGTGRSGSR